MSISKKGPISQLRAFEKPIILVVNPGHNGVTRFKVSSLGFSRRPKLGLRFHHEHVLGFGFRK